MITISYPGGTLALKVNPHEVSFGYSLNTVDFDTSAGKVVQILSTNVKDMSVSSRIGASKDAYDKYITLVKFCKDLMLWQAKNNSPATFTFPKLQYNLKVFLKGQTFTDNFNNVAYPYTLSFAIDEDVTGVVTNNAMKGVLSKVKKGVGFTSGEAGWHGGEI